MKTIRIDKREINNMDDLIDAVNQGFKKISFAIDSIEKRVDAQYSILTRIENNYVTKEKFKVLDGRVQGIEKDMKRLLEHFGIVEDNNELDSN